MKKHLVAYLVASLCVVLLSQILSGSAHGQERTFEDGLRLLRGRVMNKNDKPLAESVVYLKNTKTLMVKTFIAGQDGSYRFPALSPNVDYQVYAKHNGRQSAIKTLSAFDSHHEPHIDLKIDE